MREEGRDQSEPPALRGGHTGTFTLTYKTHGFLVSKMFSEVFFLGKVNGSLEQQGVKTTRVELPVWPPLEAGDSHLFQPRLNLPPTRKSPHVLNHAECTTGVTALRSSRKVIGLCCNGFTNDSCTARPKFAFVPGWQGCNTNAQRYVCLALRHPCKCAKIQHPFTWKWSTHQGFSHR